MKTFLLFCMTLLLLDRNVLTKRVEPHLHSEVKIVEYAGPLTNEMFKLFRGAEYIEFINCNFTSIPDRVYSDLPKLKRIYFENLTVTAIDEDIAEDSCDLEEFYYISCVWDKPHLDSWNGFHNMKKLVISDLKIPLVEIKANSLDKTRLKYLEISKSGVEKIDDLAFNNLDKLETLKLSKNKIRTISNKMLKPLKNLKKLDLHGNLIETFSASELPELYHLETINLSKNPLRNLSLNDVEKTAPKLDKIDLSDTPITVTELEELRKNSKINFVTNNSD